MKWGLGPTAQRVQGRALAFLPSTHISHQTTSLRKKTPHFATRPACAPLPPQRYSQPHEAPAPRQAHDPRRDRRPAHDGMTLGIGGWATRRKPMALVRAIVRTGPRSTLVAPYGGPDVRHARRRRRHPRTYLRVRLARGNSTNCAGSCSRCPARTRRSSSTFQASGRGSRALAGRSCITSVMAMISMWFALSSALGITGLSPSPSPCSGDW